MPTTKFAGATAVKVGLNGNHFVGTTEGGAGSTDGQTYHYYRDPELFSVVPVGGPMAGSGAAGMTESTLIVTISGRGLDSLGVISERSNPLCRFGEVTAAVVSLARTFVRCLLPSYPDEEEVLVAFSPNGQDFVHQRQSIYFDATNLTNASTNGTGLPPYLSTSSPDFLSRIVPYPHHLPNITFLDRGEDEVRVLSFSGGGPRHALLALYTNDEVTNFRLVHNGSFFMFRFYGQSIFGIQPRGGPAALAADHGSNFTVTVYGSGFLGMNDGGEAAVCRLGDRRLPVLSIRNDRIALCSVPEEESIARESVSAELSLALNGHHFISSVPRCIFTYYRQELHSIEPAGGPVGGGTVVTVQGAGFNAMRDGGSLIRCRFGDQTVRVELRHLPPFERGPFLGVGGGGGSHPLLSSGVISIAQSWDQGMGMREYERLVHFSVPPEATEGSPLPILIGLHGAGGRADAFLASILSGALADLQASYVIAIPQARCIAVVSS